MCFSGLDWFYVEPVSEDRKNENESEDNLRCTDDRRVVCVANPRSGGSSYSDVRPLPSKSPWWWRVHDRRLTTRRMARSVELSASRRPVLGSITSFQTFCIEKQSLSRATTYEAALKPYAINGGGVAHGSVDVDPTSGVLMADPVSVGTGWLYSQVRKRQFGQAISMAILFAERDGYRRFLQEAIWMLEQEQIGSRPIFHNQLLTQSVDFADSGQGWQRRGLRRLCSQPLGDWQPSDEKQSQLYYNAVPDGGMTLMLLGHEPGRSGSPSSPIPELERLRLFGNTASW